MKLTDPDSLIGQEFGYHGVDFNHFRLDDRVFEAVEDEDDGYRSMMTEALNEYRLDEATEQIFFADPIARVRVEFSEDHNEIYYLIDVQTGHMWLEFGTDNGDQYYPSFVFRHHPMGSQNDVAPEADEPEEVVEAPKKPEPPQEEEPADEPVTRRGVKFPKQSEQPDGPSAPLSPRKMSFRQMAELLEAACGVLAAPAPGRSLVDSDDLLKLYEPVSDAMISLKMAHEQIRQLLLGEADDSDESIERMDALIQKHSVALHKELTELGEGFTEAAQRLDRFLKVLRKMHYGV